MCECDVNAFKPPLLLCWPVGAEKEERGEGADFSEQRREDGRGGEGEGGCAQTAKKYSHLFK